MHGQTKETPNSSVIRPPLFEYITTTTTTHLGINDAPRQRPRSLKRLVLEEKKRHAVMIMVGFRMRLKDTCAESVEPNIFIFIGPVLLIYFLVFI